MNVFVNLKSQAFPLHAVFTFWDPTHSGDHTSLCCLKIARVVAKLWWYKFWPVESSFIHSRQKSINSYTCILWDVITRCVFLTFSIQEKTIELFHNFPNFKCSYYMKIKKHFSLQPLKLSTWFLHYWNEENLLHRFSLHVIFINLFLMKNVKIWCSELFDVLQYTNNRRQVCNISIPRAWKLESLAGMS